MEQLESTLTAIQQVLTRQTKPISIEVITDTVARTSVNGTAIQAIEEATFTVLTIDNLSGTSNNNLSTKTLAAGQTWFIGISAITLAGGSVIVYK